MRNHRARGAVRRADWGFRGTRFDAFCLRASQSIKNQMCLNSRRRFIFDNCLIMLRSATATKQLGDSVRRCQKTERAERRLHHVTRSVTEVARSRHAGGEHRRAATRYVRSGASINFRRCRRSSTSTSREKNHASAAGAGPTGVWSESERSVVGGAAAAEQERLGSRTDHHQNGHFIRTRAELRRWGNRGPRSRPRFSRPSP
jgi:hypothetical protein